jgi:predicted aminopeptidase
MSARDCSHHLARSWPWLLAALLAGALGGCSTLGYYAHLAAGETGVLVRRRPIARVIANPHTAPALRARLQLALQARAFASDALGLPRNRSYTLYADLDRPYVMYNVFATPALSLQPVRHCFPIAGCVAYQGFYQLDRAQAAAARLRAAGDDVYIGGVPAYSTLGHFADPVLSTMNRWSDDQLVGTIFHELAHQQLYVKGDTVFNESFASFVQREGLRQWHRATHRPADDPAAVRRRQTFTPLVLATRQRLSALYASDLPDAAKHMRKQAEFARLRRDDQRLRNGEWRGHDDYKAWVDGPLNNAKLLPFGLYDARVPAFAALFAQSRRNWKAFYAAARRIGQLPPAQRHAALAALAD